GSGSGGLGLLGRHDEEADDRRGADPLAARARARRAVRGGRPGLVRGDPGHPALLRLTRRNGDPLQPWHGPGGAGLLTRRGDRRRRSPRRGDDRRGARGPDTRREIRRALRCRCRSGGARVVAHVLRLRLTLLAGALRGERPGRRLLALLATVVVTIAVCVAAIGLGSAARPP